MADTVYLKDNMPEQGNAQVDNAAWCVDDDLSLGLNGAINYEVYSSYEALFCTIIPFV